MRIESLFKYLECNTIVIMGTAVITSKGYKVTRAGFWPRSKLIIRDGVINQGQLIGQG